MICIRWQLIYVEGLQNVANLSPDAMPPWAWVGMVAGVVPTAMALHHLLELPARHHMRLLKFSKFRPVSPARTAVN
ncbi:hypothetical protein ABAC460_17590 [Asticcacaulis sp. AC460]|nr:hypothetical protein ABAC460_17590 [Asticcacaulis sp. AC460]